MNVLRLAVASFLIAPWAHADVIRCDKSAAIGGDRVSISWTHHAGNGSAGHYTIKVAGKSFNLIEDKLAVRKTAKTNDPILRVHEAGYWVDRHRLFLELVPSVTEPKFGVIRLEIPELAKEGAAYIRVYKNGKTRKTRMLCGPIATD